MVFKVGYIWVGLMNVVSFFVEGCTGFGSTIVSAPVTMGVLGPRMGVPFGTMVTLPIFAVLCWNVRHNVSWKDLGKIVICTAPGLFIGSKLFYNMDESTALIALGTLVTTVAVVNIWKSIIVPFVLKKEVKEDDGVDTVGKKIFRFGCLILGGIVHGAFNTGGPLLIIYMIYAVEDKAKFRNTLVWVWLLLNGINAINQVRNGALTPELKGALAIGMPMSAVGFTLGVKFLDKINKAQFLRFVYVLLLAIGGNMLFSNLAAAGII